MVESLLLLKWKRSLSEKNKKQKQKENKESKKQNKLNIS